VQKFLARTDQPRPWRSCPVTRASRRQPARRHGPEYQR